MIDFRIKVADRIIHLRSEDPLLNYNDSRAEEFKGFVYTKTRTPDLTIQIINKALPLCRKRSVKFTVENGWRRSEYKDKFFYEYHNKKLRGRRDNFCEISKDMGDCIIYFDGDRTTGKAKRKEPGDEIISWIKTSFLQPFLAEYIIREKIGFLAHTSSVLINNKLYLFMGSTGAGKSTIAERFYRLKDAKILNDDRAIIRMDKKAYFYNIPSSKNHFERCGPNMGDRTEISSIFFPYHNSKNVMTRLDKKDAAVRIFKASFPVLWDKECLKYVLKLCSEIADSLPCYNLGAANNDSIIRFLEKGLKKGGYNGKMA